MQLKTRYLSLPTGRDPTKRDLTGTEYSLFLAVEADAMVAKAASRFWRQ